MNHNVVLITGGSGYIGSHLVWRLAAEGNRAVIYDTRAPAPEIMKISTHIRGDVRNIDGLVQACLLWKPDTVVHLAAVTGVVGGPQQRAVIRSVNIDGSINVRRAMKIAGCTNLVFASSAAVYGQAAAPHTEELPPLPVSEYGRTKADAESALLNGSHPATAVLRLFNVAGNDRAVNLNHSARMRRTLLTNAMRVLTGKKPAITLYGRSYSTPDGTAVRDYVHVSDAVDAIYKAMHKVRSGADIVANIGSGIATTNLGVVRTLEKSAHRSIPVRFGKGRKQEIIYSVADNNQARTSLGWIPTRSDVRHITDSMCQYYELT